MRSPQHILPNHHTFVVGIHSKSSLSPPTALQVKMISSNLSTEYSERNISLITFNHELICGFATEIHTTLVLQMIKLKQEFTVVLSLKSLKYLAEANINPFWTLHSIQDSINSHE